MLPHGELEYSGFRQSIADPFNFSQFFVAGAFDLARQLSARGLETSAVEILQVTANSLRFAIRSTELTGELEQ